MICRGPRSCTQEHCAEGGPREDKFDFATICFVSHTCHLLEELFISGDCPRDNFFGKHNNGVFRKTVANLVYGGQR